MPKVSVIIPCYNLGAYIDEAVDSILAQSLQDLEIIIVNDGSTDLETNRLLTGYTRPKTRVLHTENQGLPAARNNGVARATGQYICCLDADDKLHPQYLEKCCRLLDSDTKEKIGFVTTHTQCFGDSDMVWKCADYDPFRLVVENVIQVASVFRRKCWEAVGGYDSRQVSYEDWDFWLAIVAKGYEWRLIAEPLFFYRDRPGSMYKQIRNHARHKKMMVEKRADWIHEHLIEVLTAYENLIEVYQSVHTYSRAKIAENQFLQTEMALIHSSRTYRLASIFREARYSRKKLLLLPLRLGWFFVPETYKRHVRPFYAPQIAPRLKTVHNRQIAPGAPLVSVIIPCFNYGRYVEEAIDSVLAQTFQNIEIIVVDGGSTDGQTLEILNKLQKPKTTVVFRQGRHWVGSNRNHGIRLAAGRYICCLDADDRMAPTYLEKALFYLETYHWDGVYPSVRLFGEREEIWEARPATFEECFAEGNRISTVALFRKKAWQKIGGFKDWPPGEDYVPEDWEFWVRLLGRGYRFKRLKEPLMDYRFKTDGLMAASKKSLAEQRDIIAAENKALAAPRNLRRIEKRRNIRYRVKNPFINLTFKHDPQKRGILFALPFLVMGGAETVQLQLAEYLFANGYEIFIVTTVFWDRQLGDNSEAFAKFAKGIYHLPDFLEDEAEYRDFIHFLLATRKIDLIFLAGSEVVYHMLPEIRRQYPDLGVADQLYNEYGHIANNRRYAQYIDLNIVENRRVADLLTQTHNEPTSRVRIIQNGVDVHGRFSREMVGAKQLHQARWQWKIPPNKKLISYFGRFSEEKQPEFFIRLAENLRTDEDLLFLMAGQGPLFEECRERIRQAGLEDKMILPGIVDSRLFMAMSFLVILPSRIDGRPNVVLESQAMGVPVIASNVGGIPEILLDGKTGYVCDCDDLDGFASRIRTLAGNPERYASFQKAARDYAVRQFDVEASKKAYVEAFERLTAPAREPAPALPAPQTAIPSDRN